MECKEEMEIASEPISCRAGDADGWSEGKWRPFVRRASCPEKLLPLRSGGGFHPHNQKFVCLFVSFQIIIKGLFFVKSQIINSQSRVVCFFHIPINQFTSERLFQITINQFTIKRLFVYLVFFFFQITINHLTINRLFVWHKIASSMTVHCGAKYDWNFQSDFSRLRSAGCPSPPHHVPPGVPVSASVSLREEAQELPCRIALVWKRWSSHHESRSKQYTCKNC